MEKVRPWCGQPSDRGGLKNRTVQRRVAATYVAEFVEVSEQVGRLGEHEVSLDLHLLQRLHETLDAHTDTEI